MCQGAQRASPPAQNATPPALMLPHACGVLQLQRSQQWAGSLLLPLQQPQLQPQLLPPCCQACLLWLPAECCLRSGCCDGAWQATLVELVALLLLLAAPAAATGPLELLPM